MFKLFRKHVTDRDKIKLSISFLEQLKANNGIFVKDDDLFCEKGKAKTRSLYNIPEIAIAKTKFYSDSICNKHFHQSPIVEHVIVYKGEAVFKFYNKSGSKMTSQTTVKTGECITIPSGLIHVVCFHEETDLIAITIPMDKSFPK